MCARARPQRARPSRWRTPPPAPCCVCGRRSVAVWLGRAKRSAPHVRRATRSWRCQPCCSRPAGHAAARGAHRPHLHRLARRVVAGRYCCSRWRSKAGARTVRSVARCRRRDAGCPGRHVILAALGGSSRARTWLRTGAAGATAGGCCAPPAAERESADGASGALCRPLCRCTCVWSERMASSVEPAELDSSRSRRMCGLKRHLRVAPAVGAGHASRCAWRAQAATSHAQLRTAARM